MAWIALAGAVACLVAGLVSVFVTRRNVDVDELGVVSRQWLAEHSQ